MGIMVYSLYWVMQDFVHQQYESSTLPVLSQGFPCAGSYIGPLIGALAMRIG